MARVYAFLRLAVLSIVISGLLMLNGARSYARAQGEVPPQPTQAVYGGKIVIISSDSGNVAPPPIVVYDNNQQQPQQPAQPSDRQPAQLPLAPQPVQPQQPNGGVVMPPQQVFVPAPNTPDIAGTPTFSTGATAFLALLIATLLSGFISDKNAGKSKK